MAKTTLKSKVDDVIREIQSHPENFGSLGRRIEFGGKSRVTINKPGLSIKFFTPTIDVLVGIGKDHTAHLIMDTDAWGALKKGQKINIDTLQRFKKAMK